MDAWPIGYKPAKPPTSPESERAKKRKVDKQYDSGKRVRTFQAAWLVAESGWPEMEMDPCSAKYVD